MSLNSKNINSQTSERKNTKPKKYIGVNKRKLKKESIYVFCPNSNITEIEKLFNNYPFNCIVNDYSITTYKTKIICHYESQKLTKSQEQFLIQATELGAWVEPLVSFLDRRLGYTEVTLLHRGYFLHQKAFSILSTSRTHSLKRVIDLISASILSIFALPLALITALAIKLESPGPIIYKQSRTGQYNLSFNVIKFRSMRNDAELKGAKWAVVDDDRVTKVGKIIRKLRIDELPQIINVLKGEMSIVGPRPEREIFIMELEKEIPYYRFRHAVKPGITGLAQVSYPYGASISDAIWKHKYDIYYIKHHSYFLDLKIIFKTIMVVLFGLGR